VRRRPLAAHYICAAQKEEASTKSGGLSNVRRWPEEEDERIVRTAPDRRWPGWVLKLGQALDR